jgi:hypothetical protein
MQYDHLGRPRIGAFFKNVGLAVTLLAIAVVFLLSVFGTCLSDVSGRTHALAQAGADGYLEKTNLASSQGAVAACVNTDSDGDGYVSCPYVTKDGVTHPLECAGSMTINSGCRPPKAVLTQPQVPYQPR